MKVKALKAFTVRNPESGDLRSIACGAVVDVDTDDGNQLISDGLAETYTLVTPTGKVTITGTDEVDCSAYAFAQVVDENLIPGNIKKDVTILGVTGTLE